MVLDVPRRGAAQGSTRLGRLLERPQEAIAIPIGEDQRRFLTEMDLVLGNDEGLTEAQLRLAHLLDEEQLCGWPRAKASLAAMAAVAILASRAASSVPRAVENAGLA